MEIKKSSTLGEIIEVHPEVAPILAQSGLHCIGCHVSAYESIEDGCKAHGMNPKQIDEIIKMANKMVSLFDKLPKVSFTPNAIKELSLRAKKSKVRFIKVRQLLGEFDFDAVPDKDAGDLELKIVAGKEPLNVLLDKKIERLLRGIKIDYDKSKKDFVAISERKLEF